MPLSVPNQCQHLDVLRRNGGASLQECVVSLNYSAAQPLRFGSQFIKFYCIAINMQNSDLKGIQKYNQESESKSPL